MRFSRQRPTLRSRGGELAGLLFRLLCLPAALALQAQTGVPPSPRPELLVNEGVSANSIATSPDGRWFATLEHGRVGIVGTSNLFVYRMIDVGGPAANTSRSLCVGHDGRHIYLGASPKKNGDGGLAEIDVDSGKLVSRGDRVPQRVACHPFRPLLATAEGDHLSLREETDAHERLRLPLAHPVSGGADVDVALAFTPDGENVLYVAAGRAILWDWRTNKQVWQIDARAVHSKNLDRRVNATDISTGVTKPMTADALETWQFRAFAFSDDGSLLALLHEDECTVLSTIDGSVIDGWSLTDDSPAWGLSFLDENHVLVGGNKKMTEHAVGEKTTAPVKVPSIRSSLPLPGRQERLALLWGGDVRVWNPKQHTLRSPPVTSTATDLNFDFGAEGHSLLVPSSQNSPSVWNLDTGRNDTSAVQQNDSFWLGTSPGGRWLTFFGSEGGDAIRLHVWDREHAMERASMKTGPGSIRGRDVAFSDDGRWMAAVAGAPRQLRVWETVSFSPVSVPALQFPDGHCDCTVAFRPGGKMLAIANHTEVDILIWSETEKRWVSDRTLSLTDEDVPMVLHLNVGDRLSRTRSHIDSLQQAGFSPDGKRLVVTGGVMGHIFNTSTWTEETPVPGMGYDFGFTRDGHLLVTSTNHPEGLAHLDDPLHPVLTVWDLEQSRAVLRDERVVVSGALRVSPDGKLVAIASDGGIGLFRTADATKLATLYRFGGNDWLAVAPDGTFDGTPGGWNHLSWRFNGQTFQVQPLELYFREFFQPGTLARQLAAQPEVAHDLSQVANRILPEVAITSIGPGSSPGRVDVTVHLARTKDKGQSSGARDLRLFRDGKLVGSGTVNVPDHGQASGGLISGPVPDGDYVFHDVALRTDESTWDYIAGGARPVTFTAYAFNDALVRSLTARAEWTPRGGDHRAPRKGFVLAIGVNQYSAQHCDLLDAVSDAEMMAKTVGERLRANGLQEVDVDVLRSAAAGKEAIRLALELIGRRATPNDVVLVTFSGHGYAERNGLFYLLPADVTGDCHKADDRLLHSSISSDELARWLSPIDAGEITVVLDACHSAESIQAGEFRAGPLGSSGLGQLAYDKGMRVLAASQADGVALEFHELLQHGLLTYILIQQGLVDAKADWRPQDGTIGLDEWLAYAERQVPLFSPGEFALSRAKAPIPDADKQTSRGQALQQPALFDFGGGSDITLQVKAATAP